MSVKGLIQPQVPALLALEDGSVFSGYSIGATGHAVGEVVFNTAMSGYQEILTDPSYAEQMVTLTYPHIGNVGVNPDDQESDRVHAKGLIIRELSMLVSSWRAKGSLSDYLKANNTIAIAGVDTRRLTRLLRDKGAQNGCLMAGDVDADKAIAAAKAFPGLNGLDLAKVVTTKMQYAWSEKTQLLEHLPKTSKPFHIIAYDFGVKRQILRMLADRGCRVTVVPAQTSAQDVLAMKPDGVFLSNGPGDPATCEYAVQAIKTLLDKNMPLFGICLGCQLLALACGAQTSKMKFGHHGANHPVQDLRSQHVMITSQNHGFVVDEKSLPTHLSVTHRSLFDQTLQGIQHNSKPAFAFQGHPEASPGPHDIGSLFDDFIEMIIQHQSEKHYAKEN